MPGRFDYRKTNIFKADLIPIVDGMMGKCTHSGSWGIDLGAGCFSKVEVTGNEVGMQVRLENVGDPESHLLCHFDIPASIPGWINNRTGPVSGDNIGAVCDTGDEELVDNH
jgi:hypothetical protein